MAADFYIEPEFDRWDAFVPPAGKGAWPWRARTVVALGLLALLALIMATVIWSLRHVQTRVSQSLDAHLSTSEFNGSALMYESRWRDITIDGELPAGMTADAFSNRLRGINDGAIRNVRVFARESKLAVNDSAGNVDVSARLKDGRLVLEGAVLTDSQKQSLIDAATDTFGITNVIDRLQVSGLDEQIPGSDARVSGLANAVRGLGGVVAADMRLSARELRFNATAVDESRADDLERLRGNAGDFGLVISGDIVARKSAPDSALDVEVNKDGRRLILSGSVLSNDQWRRLDDAARGAAEDVLNNVEVVEGTDSLDDSDLRVAVLETAITDFGRADEVRARITSGKFVLDAEVEVQEQAESMRRARADALALGLKVDGNIESRELSLDREMDLLDSEIRVFEDEIRRSLNFNRGSSELDFTAKQALNRVVDALLTYQRPSVQVVGHTDSRGNADDNSALSLSRASAVVDYLFDSGVETSRLRAIGLGESSPIASNETEFGRQQNRRVEFLVVERLNR